MLRTQKWNAEALGLDRGQAAQVPCPSLLCVCVCVCVLLHMKTKVNWAVVASTAKGQSVGLRRCPCPGLLGSGHQSASTSVLIVPKCRAGSAVFSIRGLYLRNFLSCFFSFRLKETNSKIALTARLLLNAHLFRPAAPPSSPPSEARRAAGCETRSCWARILAWRAHILTEGFGVNGSASVACPAHGRATSALKRGRCREKASLLPPAPHFLARNTFAAPLRLSGELPWWLRW